MERFRFFKAMWFSAVCSRPKGVLWFSAVCSRPKCVLWFSTVCSRPKCMLWFFNRVQWACRCKCRCSAAASSERPSDWPENSHLCVYRYLPYEEPSGAAVFMLQCDVNNPVSNCSCIKIRVIKWKIVSGTCNKHAWCEKRWSLPYSLPWRHRGRVQEELCSFFNPRPGGGGWSTPHLGRCSRGIDAVPFVQ